MSAFACSKLARLTRYGGVIGAALAAVISKPKLAFEQTGCHSQAYGTASHRASEEGTIPQTCFEVTLEGKFRRLHSPARKSLVENDARLRLA